MESYPERVGRNESIFREVNERIRTVGEPHGPDAPLELVCECADASCAQQVRISGALYESVRAHPRRFIVSRGHVHPEHEREVEAAAAFSVVEKVAEAGEVAAETDPRNGDGRDG